MRRHLHKSLVWTVVLSEITHVFCCVFPTIFSLLSLLAGLGLAITIPASMIAFHNFMHHWELPIIAGSGFVLLVGWLVTLYSDKVECHHHGCGHEACAPHKGRTHTVLKIATALFLFNLTIYLAVHHTPWFEANSPLMQQDDAHPADAAR